MYFLLLVFGSLGYCFYKREKIQKKYKQFREVNKLVGIHYKSFGKIIYISLSMIAKMYWMNFIKWLEGAIEIKDGILVMSYVYNGKIYKLPLKGKKGPSPIIIIVDENGEECTDLILPYFGPNYNWHGGSFTPEFWGKNSLTFELASGENKLFRKEEKIKINIE